MYALSPPTWRELEEQIAAAAGPYEARRGRSVWQVVDTRTGRVRATCSSEREAERRAGNLNRSEASR